MTSSPSPLRAASRRRLSQARTPIAAMMALIMAVVTAQVPADAAGAAPWKPPKPKDVTGVAVKPLKHAVRPSWTAGAREVRAAGTAARWPQAGTATVDLTTGVRQRAGALPVWVSPHAGRARASAATGQEAVGHVTVGPGGQGRRPQRRGVGSRAGRATRRRPQRRRRCRSDGVLP